MDRTCIIGDPLGECIVVWPPLEAEAPESDVAQRSGVRPVER